MIDWSNNARTGTYKPKHRKVEYETAAPGIKSFFLGIVIENDFFAPYPSTKSLLDKFPVSDTEIYTAKTERFKTITPDHFSWLKEPGPAVDVILEWLSRKGLTGQHCVMPDQEK